MKRGLWFLASLFVLLHPLQVYAADELMLGGNSVGIEIDYDGVDVYKRQIKILISAAS